MSTTTNCGVANPGGQPCTQPKGHPKGHDLASYGPQPAPGAEGEWRVEHFTKDGADEWMVVKVIDGKVIRTVALANTNDSEQAEREMRQIVRDHFAVPKLVEALNELNVRVKFALSTPGFIRGRDVLEKWSKTADAALASTQEKQ